MGKKDTLYIYVRCSTDKQIENSIQRQIELGINFSKEMKMKYKIYSDGGMSGLKSMETRDQWMELMWEIQMGYVKHLWCEDYTRVTRNFEDQVLIDKLITENDLNVYEGISNNSQYQPDQLSQRLIKVVTSLVGSEQKKDEIKKSIQGKIRKIEQGLHIRGNVTFGYDKKDQMYVINKEESKWVKKIFKMYSQGMSLRLIVRELKINGVKSKRGKTFSERSVHILLSNKEYIGIYTYTDKTLDQHRKDPKRFPYPDESKWITYNSECERIITDDLFYKVQKELRTDKPQPTKYNYLLHGKIKCNCGCDWVGRRTMVRKDIHFHYVCSNSVRRYDRNRIGCNNLYKEDICNKPKRISCKELDVWIWDHLLKTLRNSSFIKERVKNDLLGTKYDTSSSRRRINSDLKEFNKELISLKNSKVELLKEKFTLKLSENEFNDINSTIIDRINEVKSKLHRVRETEKLLDQRSEWIDWIGKHHKDVDEYSKVTDVKQKRRIIDIFVDHISISYDHDTQQHDIKVNYIYPLVNDGVEYVKKRDSKVKWDKWGNGYKVKKGDQVISLSHLERNKPISDVVVSVHSTVTDFKDTTTKYFISFIYRYQSSDFVFKKVLDLQHQNLHNLIMKLKSEGLGYRKISKRLNEMNVRSYTNKKFYPSLVSEIYKKITRKQQILNQPVISEYSNFDIGIYK